METLFLARHRRVSHAPSHPGQWSTWPQRLEIDGGESRKKARKLARKGERGERGERRILLGRSATPCAYFTVRQIRLRVFLHAHDDHDGSFPTFMLAIMGSVLCFSLVLTDTGLGLPGNFKRCYWYKLATSRIPNLWNRRIFSGSHHKRKWIWVPSHSPITSQGLVALVLHAGVNRKFRELLHSAHNTSPEPRRQQLVV